MTALTWFKWFYGIETKRNGSRTLFDSLFLYYWVKFYVESTNIVVMGCLGGPHEIQFNIELIGKRMQDNMKLEFY